MHTTESDAFAGSPDLGAPDEVGRRFEIWPHRSLGASGVLALFGTLAAGWAVGVYSAPRPLFWPIFFGCTLAFIGVAAAFLSNIRAANVREIVEFGPRSVRVFRIGNDGRSSVVSFATHWVRVQVKSDRDVNNRLTLAQSDRRVSIGAFLSPAERADLAEAFAKVLAEAKGHVGAGPSDGRKRMSD